MESTTGKNVVTLVVSQLSYHKSPLNKTQDFDGFRASVNFQERISWETCLNNKHLKL